MKEKFSNDIRQFEINYISSCLLFCNIRTNKDLITKLDTVIAQIEQNQDIFKKEFSNKQCFDILKKGLEQYNKINDCHISLSDDHLDDFNQAMSWRKPKSAPLYHIPVQDDLSQVTKSYDRLEQAHEETASLSQSILALVSDADPVIIPQVVIGTGDTGTTLWLEKYASLHNKAKNLLANKTLPPVLMIGEDTGSWRHDYTLAQPHSILERMTAKENPSSYLSRDHYQTNPYANARHMYQANQANLGLTEAPILRASILGIETKALHQWVSPAEKYRIIIRTTAGIKYIYTNNIDICTGLGPAREAISGHLLNKQEFTRLNKLDPKKGFTPIVDGNHFILTGTEENKIPREIVIYGGGGTAAACYRKGFFGNDVRTQDKPFIKENQCNSMVWVAKQFNKAGTGKLASTALTTANDRGELRQGELVKIEQINDRFLLTFKDIGSENTYKLDCDQLIYSVGQDDSLTRSLCQEIESDVSLFYDQTGMVLGVRSADRSVVFFGAAAMAVKEKEYMAATAKWLKEEHIRGDVGPGSMPPSRAQIKRYNFLNNIPTAIINANMDSQHLIVQYLLDQGIALTKVHAFVDDLLVAREESTGGACHKTLQELLDRHGLNEQLELKGLTHLIAKKSTTPPPAKAKQKPLAWLSKDKAVQDADIIMAEAEKIPHELALENQTRQKVSVYS